MFLKGCPLRCVWCHNPEGLTSTPQLLYKKNLCTHCNRCKIPCNHPECTSFNRCIHACANNCLSVSGTDISANALADKLHKNKEILKMLGGGITLSGGEPMLHADFVCELADKLSDIHLAIQTSGYTDFSIYKSVIDKFDFIMQDIKLADDEAHQRYTGVSNAPILQNIEYLKSCGKPFVFRVPLIPNITDTDQNLKALSKIAESFPVELLRYNTMAGAKYEMLGTKYSLGNTPNRTMDFTKYFRNAKLE